MRYVLGTVKPETSLSPVRVRARGRRCAQEDCATILSIYNRTKYCCLHQRRLTATPARQRIDGELTTRRCAHAKCGAVFEARNPRRLYCSDRCRMAAFELRGQGEPGRRGGACGIRGARTMHRPRALCFSERETGEG